MSSANEPGRGRSGREPQSPVNSFNEWDPLREIIVGSARGAAEMGYEPALSPYFPPQGRDFRGGPVHAAVIDEAERQLDAFAELLARRGVTVRRPDPLDHTIPFSTPTSDRPCLLLVCGGHGGFAAFAHSTGSKHHS